MKQIMSVMIEIEANNTHSVRNIEEALNFYWGSNGTFKVTEARKDVEMKVSKNGKTFEITGIEDAAVAARFLRQNGFTIINESHDVSRPTLLAADGGEESPDYQDFEEEDDRPLCTTCGENPAYANETCVDCIEKGALA